MPQLFLIGILFGLSTVPLRAESLLNSTTGQASVILIDPEATHLPTPPPVPTEPPSQVRLPDVISDRSQWRGVQCGVTEPRFALFRHGDKWRAFWEKGLAPYSPRLAYVPVVDFDHEMVVAVFLGERETPYFEVEIQSARVEKQSDGTSALVVRYREIRKMSGVFVPEFPVQPFHLRKIPLFDGPIRFLDLRAPKPPL